MTAPLTHWLAGALLLAPGPAARAAERAVAVDESHSTVEVEVRATMTVFTARLEHYRAEIRYDPDTATVTRAQFEFAFADLRTGAKERDTHLLAWEDAPRFPRGVFRLTQLGRDDQGVAYARGDLTLHGITRGIRFPVTVLTEGRLVAIDGVAGLDFRDFGLPPLRKFLVLRVDPLLAVRFHLQGRVESPNVAASAHESADR